MAPRKTSKTKAILLRVGEADYVAWKAEAEKAGVTLTEFIRRRTNLRPLTARKRKYAELAKERDAQEEAKEGAGNHVACPTGELPCQQDDDDDDWDPKTDPVLMPEEAEWQARLESEDRAAQARERRNRANILAYSAGGATRWFSLMTPEQLAEWADLKEVMLRSERMGGQTERLTPERFIR